MLKIAYVVYGSPMERHGVPEKIRFQLKALSELSEVCLFLMNPFSDELITGYPAYINVISGNKGDNIFSEIKWNFIAVSRLERGLKKFQPDIIYVRYPLYRPRLATALKNIAPYVLEINTKTLDELRLLGRAKALWVEKIFGGLLLKNSSGLIGVTEEIIKSELQRIRLKKAIPVKFIGNGVDTKSIPFPQQFRRFNKELHIAMLGHEAPWHGRDRIMKMMCSYKAKQITLHLIGNSCRDRRQMVDADIQGKIIFHEWQSGQELDNILSKVDLCFGPVALHRKRMQQATPLKVRRYLAHGIPTVIGYDDPDIPQNSDFVLRVPANEDALDVEVILKFADKVRYDNSIRIKARRFAEQNLDWRVKMKQLHNFLLKVLKYG